MTNREAKTQKHDGSKDGGDSGKKYRSSTKLFIQAFQYGSNFTGSNYLQGNIQKEK